MTGSLLSQTAAPPDSDKRCRLCGAMLTSEPIFGLPRVPCGAQAFLRPEEIPDDVSVDLDVYQCGECALVQLARAAVPYWQEVITAAAYSPAMLSCRREQARHFAARFDLRGVTVLEVGCGRGQFLESLQQAGVDAVGLEASEASVRVCRERGLRAVRGYPSPGATVEGAPFGAFAAINVLEHAVAPGAFLRGVRENLLPGSVGMVEVPSLERMLEEERYYDFVADHLSYFTAETLSSTLQCNGFEVLEVSRDWWHDDLVAFVRVRRTMNLANKQRCLEGLVAEVRAFVAEQTQADRTVAVWGASHQALTLLALAGPNGIAYVIDSAPFKQGLYTPASHLPIVAPSVLAETPPDAVLVMAAGYSDEVARVLAEDLRFAGTVGVLRGNAIVVSGPEMRTGQALRAGARERESG